MFQQQDECTLIQHRPASFVLSLNFSLRSNQLILELKKLDITVYLVGVLSQTENGSEAQSQNTISSIFF